MGQAKLVPLGKKNKDVRPIVIGCVDRRLTVKCVVRKYKTDFADHFTPLQHGVGVAGGIETIRHYAGALKAEHPDWAFLAVDFSNAFHTINRLHCLRETAHRFPTLMPFLQRLYLPISKLWLNLASGKEYIESAEGAQQGDPLGPFLFAAGLQPALEQAQQALDTIHPTGCVLAYLDDVLIAGPSDHAVHAFKTLKEAASGSGLKVNEGKCVFFLSRRHRRKTRVPTTRHRSHARRHPPAGIAVRCRRCLRPSMLP